MGSSASDLSKYITAMTPVKRGDSPRIAARHERMNAIQGAIKALIRGENIVNGENIRKKSFGSSVLLSATKQRQFGAEDHFAPFEVVPADDGANLYVADGHISVGEDRDRYEILNQDWGLDTLFPIPDIGEKIWIEIRLNADQTVSDAQVFVGPVAGSDWPFYPDPIEILGGTQQAVYHQIIAEINDPIDPRQGQLLEGPNGQVKLIQLLLTDLMMVPAHTTRDADEPNLPLLVAMPWSAPGSLADGSSNEFTATDDLMTPWAFGTTTGFEDLYSFRIIDVTDFIGPRVLILDGKINGVFPTGMVGLDNFALDLINDDELDPETAGENDIYLEVDYGNDGSINEAVVHIDTPDNVPESQFGDRIFLLGRVFVHKGYRSDNGVPFYSVVSENTQCGDIDLQLIPTERYAFQMLDASDDSGPYVLITDGDVVDQFGNAVTVDGMGNDDFILPVPPVPPATTNDIYMGISYDKVDFSVREAWIAAGEMPADDPGLGIVYVQVGYVEIFKDEGDLVPEVDIHNVIAGDYVFIPPRNDQGLSNRYAFELFDASTDTQARLQVKVGGVVDEEGVRHLPDGMELGDIFEDLAPEDQYAFLFVQFDRDSGDVLNPPSVGFGSAIPDDSPGKQYIEIGHFTINTVEGKPVVAPVNTLTGDYFFQLDDGDIGYAFQLLDSTETQPAEAPVYKVLILDGSVVSTNGDEFLPDGMTGVDDYVLTLDFSSDDRISIFLIIPHNDRNEVTGVVTIDQAADVPFDDPGTMYVEIGHATVDAGDLHLIVRNALSGDFVMADVTGGTAIDINHYSFEIVDASDGAGAKVLIFDGLVFGPNDDGQLPSGMTGSDDFILPVANDDEIWIETIQNEDSNDVIVPSEGGITIANGPDTPNDFIADGLIHRYVTIGAVAVDISGTTPVIEPTNFLCGDYTIPYDLVISGPDDVGVVHPFHGVNGVNLLGAVSIEHDPEDPNPESLDISIGPDVTDENRTEPIFNPVAIKFVTDFITDHIVEAGTGEDDGAVIVHIGFIDVQGDPDAAEGIHSFDNANKLSFPGAIIEDGGDGTAEITLDTIATVTVLGFKDDGAAENQEAGQLRFTGAVIAQPDTDFPDDPNAVEIAIGADLQDTREEPVESPSLYKFTTIPNPDDADIIVEPDPTDEDAAIVHVGLAVSVFDEVYGDGRNQVERILFTRTPTVDLDPDHICTDNDGGEVIVHLPLGSLLIEDQDNGSVPNVEEINLEGAVVSSTGTGVAKITVTATPALSIQDQFDHHADEVDQIELTGALVTDLGNNQARIDIFKNDVTQRESEVGFSGISTFNFPASYPGYDIPDIELVQDDLSDAEAVSIKIPVGVTVVDGVSGHLPVSSSVVVFDDADQVYLDTGEAHVSFPSELPDIPDGAGPWVLAAANGVLYWMDTSVCPA